MITQEQILSDVVKLVSLPEVCIRVNDMVDDPIFGAADIGEVIATDPGLTARLLHIVNSSFYGFPSKIETMSRAITIVGVQDLRDLVLATSAIDAFKNLPNDLIDMGEFWRHSVFSAVLARGIARECNVLHAERLFIAGLIHDVGKLVLYNKVPEQAREALLIAGDNPQALPAAEKETIGFSHADIGGELAERWHFPPSLVESTRHHHDAWNAPKHRLEASIVNAADVVAMGLEAEAEITEIEALLHPETIAMTQLTYEKLTHVVDNAHEEFDQVCGVLLPIEFQMF